MVLAMETPEATASAIIDFVERLEDDSLAFYEKLAERFPMHKAVFLSFVGDVKKNKASVIRTYRETITDALEACFSFKGLNLNDYMIKTNIAENSSFSDALKVAVRLEEEASEFYTDVAEQCKSLLATIPRAFKAVADERNRRKQRLESLLHNAK